MPTLADDCVAELEKLLAPLEQRPVTVDRETMLRRREGATLGHELNRVQGASYTALDARLDRLWRNGQVTKAEYVGLVADIGRRGLFTEQPLERDGR